MKDFYKVGRTYTGKYGWKFRADVITTHPEDRERTALGWRFWEGKWEPYAYEEDHWTWYRMRQKEDPSTYREQ